MAHEPGLSQAKLLAKAQTEVFYILGLTRIRKEEAFFGDVSKMEATLSRAMLLRQDNATTPRDEGSVV